MGFPTRNCDDCSGQVDWLSPRNGRPGRWLHHAGGEHGFAYEHPDGTLRHLPHLEQTPKLSDSQWTYLRKLAEHGWDHAGPSEGRTATSLVDRDLAKLGRRPGADEGWGHLGYLITDYGRAALEARKATR